MAELPFGANPFTNKKGRTHKDPRLESSVQPTSILPPPPSFTEKHVTQKRKLGETHGKEDAKKKHKIQETASSTSVINTFTDLAKENYSASDVQVMHSRSALEADDRLRVAIGEVFVHGLDCLSAKDERILDLERTLKKYKDASNAHKQQITEIQKKTYEEVVEAKKESERLAKLLKEADLAAKEKDEAHNKALAALQTQMESAENDKALSDTYTAGFLGYLKSFLGADYNYDWSAHFAPSTVTYIDEFKVGKAEEI